MNEASEERRAAARPKRAPITDPAAQEHSPASRAAPNDSHSRYPKRSPTQHPHAKASNAKELPDLGELPLLGTLR